MSSTEDVGRELLGRRWPKVRDEVLKPDRRETVQDGVHGRVGRVCLMTNNGLGRLVVAHPLVTKVETLAKVDVWRRIRADMFEETTE